MFKKYLLIFLFIFSISFLTGKNVSAEGNLEFVESYEISIARNNLSQTNVVEITDSNILFLACNQHSGYAINSATWNNVDFVYYGSVNGNTGQSRTNLWYMLEPDEGFYYLTITKTQSDQWNETHCGLFGYKGLDTSIRPVAPPFIKHTAGVDYSSKQANLTIIEDEYREEGSIIGFTMNVYAPIYSTTDYTTDLVDSELDSTVPDYKITAYHYNNPVRGNNIFYYPSHWSGRGYSNMIVYLKTGQEQTPFSITSPTQDEIKIKESWITVEGNCPTDGLERIAFTNDCSDFSNLDYTVSCVNNAFSSQFYYDGLSDFVVAVEEDSTAGDCVDYDDLMSVVEIEGIEIIEGYPDDWHFNYDYYNDFDIVINSPIFDTALTLPNGTGSVDMSFSFIYPRPLSPFVVFNIKQYDSTGNLLNNAYHTKILAEMIDTDDYVVNLTASTSELHYVVQLINNSELTRQFAFGVYASDLDLIINPDEYRYLFPRLVEKLKQKVVFNYYFAFYDGFYDLFNNTATSTSPTALDITFNSMSDDNEFNLEIPIFKGSDSIVKAFTTGIRPFVIAFLWLGFAVYVLMRVNKLFGSDE